MTVFTKKNVNVMDGILTILSLDSNSNDLYYKEADIYLLSPKTLFLGLF